MKSFIHALALCSALLCLLLAAPIAAAQSTWDSNYPFSNRIVETTFLYAEASEDSRKVTIVNAGADVHSTACVDGWCPIKLGDGERGYVQASALARPEFLTRQQPTANPDVHSAPSRPTSPATQSTPAPAELHQDTLAERFVGSSRSQVFHRASCRHVSRIAAHNLVTYESAAAALEQGKRPCKSCHPSDD